MTSKNLHLLISGPIRPNIDYINYFIKLLKSVTFSIFDVKIYLCYWKTPSIDKKDIENVDYLYEITEPDDSYIFENVLERTKQQRSLGSIEHWTPRMYKMLYNGRIYWYIIQDKSIKKIKKQNATIKCR